MVTGPTGSGKTSTLYSMLREINSESINVVTIEDPIEYEIENINQVQINEKRGLTFAGGLRAILRQDPDVIMVGEMRDAETAEIAFRAALTGHQVLSTLHTNTALYTINRLIDMGIQPYLISSALTAVVAQRLVRRICTHYWEMYQPDKDELAKKLKLTPDDIPPVLFRGRGCEACSHRGYKGRMGIFEIVNIDEQIKEQITQGATKAEMFQTARGNGMKTLAEDGLLKAFLGFTTIDEVSRMTSLNDVDRTFIASITQRELDYNKLSMASGMINLRSETQAQYEESSNLEFNLPTSSFLTISSS